MSVSTPLRILVTRQNTYPARAYPVSTEGLASLRITDLIVKGLAELGHEVHYQVQLDQIPLPEGVRWVANGALPSVDITHRQKVFRILFEDQLILLDRELILVCLDIGIGQI